MDRVDEMSQDIIKYNTYMRNTSKQQQQKHQVSRVSFSATHHGADASGVLQSCGDSAGADLVTPIPEENILCLHLYLKHLTYGAGLFGSECNAKVMQIGDPL